jgi:3-hydroxyacyl-CoA dehydrogenase / enoyl-CoA hydratase / 3-hydroxybutyryl-CoA epimerase
MLEPAHERLTAAHARAFLDDVTALVALQKTNVVYDPAPLREVHAEATSALAQTGIRQLIVVLPEAGELDLAELVHAGSGAALQDWLRACDRLIELLETARVPVVAVVPKHALGLTFELALACDAIVALASPDARLGLPYAIHGLIPAASRTAARLARRTTTALALRALFESQTLTQREARDAGWIDTIARDPDELWRLAGEARATRERIAEPLDLAALDELGAELGERPDGNYEAARALLELARCPADRAREAHAQRFMELASSTQAASLVRIMCELPRAARAFEGIACAAQPGIREVGVVGLGNMGAALAVAAARHGYRVLVHDLDAAALAEFSRMLDETCLRDSGGPAPDVRVARRPTDFARCDLVLEAVFEELEVKHAVMRELEPQLAPRSIWASNTTTLPIRVLAEVARRPERVIGLHFMPPAEQPGSLVEIVRAAAARADVLERAAAFCRAVGKLPIESGDDWGFVTSKLFAVYMLEVVLLLAEGCDPRMLEACAPSTRFVPPPLRSFPPPVQLLDADMRLFRILFRGCLPALHEAEYQPAMDLIALLIDREGRVGRAAGGGFYDYRDERPQPWPGLRDLTPAAARPSAQLIHDRLVLAESAAAVRCLERGLARARDIELAAVWGVGFAPELGGPLAYLERLGLTRACARMRELAAAYGARFEPPGLLLEAERSGARLI